MTDLQILVRQTSNPSNLKMQQRLHEEVIVLGKQALEWRAKCESLESTVKMLTHQMTYWVQEYEALMKKQLAEKASKVVHEPRLMNDF